LDAKNVEALQKAGATMIESMEQNGVEIPVNKRIYKSRDCSAFNFFYQKNEDDGEPKIDTARAAYVPTESQKRIWLDSWIYKDTHIQICVRTQSNILAVWHSHRDGRYGKAKSGL